MDMHTGTAVMGLPAAAPAVMGMAAGTAVVEVLATPAAAAVAMDMHTEMPAAGTVEGCTRTVAPSREDTLGAQRNCR
jgi:hypothetical protein